MPSQKNKSYGPIVEARTRRVLQAILLGVAGERDLIHSKALQFNWRDEGEVGQKLTIGTTLQTLVHLTNQDGQQPKIEIAHVREALEAMRNFLGILQDHRGVTQGSRQWNFTLTLSSDRLERNLKKFDDLWEKKRSPKAKSQSAPRAIASRSGLKPGAPFPNIRLPENYVERPDALKVVKEKLLAQHDRTLVVSAIAGLGGLGKSVLATALVLDAEVQARFADGILWVTLGQKPDLQSLLGDWIGRLDKSRESYSATTLESASSYLHTLLLEKQMLLVVDDAWNGAHVEHFRVGGAECRMLVTTREAQIEDAEYHSLDLMSETEAISLVQQKLKRQWQPEQELEVKAFAKSLGYLPLALDLAANQVRDGLSWGELRAEFEAERRAVALEILDSSEAWDRLDGEQQRKYSLRACFNLSLRRLNDQQLRQFAWLGVLPEDVSIDVRMAITLWELPRLQAKKVLGLLQRRSFLTSGTETLEGEPTYRVHDLMHDTARGLIEAGELNLATQTPGFKSQNLTAAHAQLLDRYRQQTQGRWDELPNDGYIYRHLTWHFVQAGLEDEIHTLLAMSDDQGRNAWFEACDRIGQPAIFVQDLKRGWEVAEQCYENDQTRSIVLQCRYALITATLNSLVGNLPVQMMAEFVKRKYWAPEQAWAYVEQMQDEGRVAEAIEALASCLPKSIFELAVEKARSMQDESNRAEILKDLAQLDSAYFAEALSAARSIQDEDSRAGVLSALAQLDSACFAEALSAARSIQSEDRRAWALKDLAQLDSACFAETLDAARSIQDEDSRAKVLSALAQLDSAYFAEALDAARSIQDEDSRAWALKDLAQLDSAYFAEALDAAQSMQSKDSRAKVLSALAQLDSADFAQLLDAARSLQSKDSQAGVLSALAQLDSADFAQLLDAARSLQSKDSWAEVLSALAQLDSADFAQLLDAARSIQDEDSRTLALRALAQLDSAYFAEALSAARSIQDENSRALALRALAQLDSADFAQLLDAAQLIQDEDRRAWVLRDLAQLDSAYFAEALSVARSIQSEYNRAEILKALAQLDSAYFAEALSVARSIQDEDSRAWALKALAQLDSACFAEALDAARSIQDEDRRAEVLSALAQLDSADFAQLLGAARSIQDEYSRAGVLSALAQLDSAYFAEALDAAQSIQDEYRRAWVLKDLAQLDSADFAQLLDVAQSMQFEHSRAEVLRALAQLDSADFAQLLDAAQSMQSGYNRAWVLSALAQLDSADFAQLLNAARLIQDEDSQARGLSALAEKLPEAFLTQVFKVIDAIAQKPIRAKALSAYLPRLPLATLSHSNWCTYLHLLAHRTRKDLTQDLVMLHPAIVHLGGTSAIRGMVDAMRDMCSQWK